MSNDRTKLGLTSQSRNAPADREDVAHAPEGRPERVKLTGNYKTQFPLYKRDDKKYYYYVFADVPDEGKIDAAKASYYEQCFYENGSPCVVRPNGLPHHLMRIPIEYKIQDDLDRERDVRATLGESNKIKDGEYAPNGGKSAFTVNDDDPLDPRL